MSDPVQRPDESPRGFKAAHEILGVAMNSLPAQWRAVLWYVDVMGADRTQAAALMRIAPEEVSPLLEAARAGLRQACLEASDNASEKDPGRNDGG